MTGEIVAEAFVVDDVKNAPDVKDESGYELLVNGDVVDSMTSDDENGAIDEMLKTQAKQQPFEPGDIILIQRFKVIKRVTLK